MSNREATLKIDVMNIYMVHRALRFQGLTARMCGNPLAEAEAYKMAEQLEPLIPACVKIFDEEKWTTIGALLKKCEFWSVNLRSKNYGWNEGEGEIHIEIGWMQESEGVDTIHRGSWKAEKYSKWDSPFVDELKQILSDAAHVDAIYWHQKSEVSKPYDWDRKHAT